MLAGRLLPQAGQLGLLGLTADQRGLATGPELGRELDRGARGESSRGTGTRPTRREGTARGRQSPPGRGWSRAPRAGARAGGRTHAPPRRRCPAARGTASAACSRTRGRARPRSTSARRAPPSRAGPRRAAARRRRRLPGPGAGCRQARGGSSQARWPGPREQAAGGHVQRDLGQAPGVARIVLVKRGQGPAQLGPGGLEIHPHRLGQDEHHSVRPEATRCPAPSAAARAACAARHPGIAGRPRPECADQLLPADRAQAVEHQVGEQQPDLPAPERVHPLVAVDLHRKLSAELDAGALCWAASQFCSSCSVGIPALRRGLAGPFPRDCRAFAVVVLR